MAKAKSDSQKITFGKEKEVMLKNLITNILQNQNNIEDKDDERFIYYSINS